MIRNVLLCSLATLTLAACGGESGSGSSAAGTSSHPTTAVVQSNTGIINRSPGTATVASTTPPKTATTTPPSGSGTAVSGGTKTTPVKPVPTSGVATLDWMPPTSNSDGSALTNLAGYTVYYGTSPNDLSQSVKVSNPGLATYSVTGLASGTWYFAVTSYSADGVESGRTNTVSTTI
ncbi:MAG: fibronectin type III domain-containing protein [Proteobacteria bacterium]|nr:fibronectin type III domain-containing protein [Pseudomonadota bacterium]